MKLSISVPLIAAWAILLPQSPQRCLIRATSLVSGALALGQASLFGAAVVRAWLKRQRSARDRRSRAAVPDRPPARPPGPARGEHAEPRDALISATVCVQT
ncbi:MAG TPA: hypothetical protein VGK95_14300 [Caldimonas sp.]